MTLPANATSYQTAYYNLKDSQSELNIAKRKFENIFQLFLNRYRPYSSVGRTLTEPIFDIRTISDTLR